ncbi:MAG: TIGR04211 family SH3 domain-containing protein [Chromatiales bacterium]|jgi:SH3 domain protein
MLRFVLGVCLALALSASVGAQTVQYISDELSVAVRRGKTLQHRIIRFEPSGTPVEVLEVSEEDGFTRVRTPNGTEGWVLSAELRDQPGAAQRLEAAQERIAALRADLNARRDEVAALESALEMRSREAADLQRQVEILTAELEETRVASAEPLRLAEDNERLASELESERQRATELEQENARLSSRSLKEWFVLGAAVSLGSLVLGALLTRIPWRRERWNFH